MTGFFRRKLFPSLPTKQAPQENKPMDRFEKALAYVLGNEGPYSNDPRDPGGATKYGIILTEYQSYLGKTLTPEDVKNMGLDTAKAIYLKKFWHPIKGDEYASDAAATAIFDTAVNKGLGGCKIILEDALGQHFGGEAWEYQEDLVSAVNSKTAPDFLKAISDATVRYIEKRVQRFPAMAWAERGWINRAHRIVTLGA